jgi:hypothetical protein
MTKLKKLVILYKLKTYLILGLNMFLVPTFCEIIKNSPYILKIVKKIL